MIPVVVLLAKGGVVDSDLEYPLALSLLAELDRSALPDLRLPLIGAFKARRLKLNLPSILVPIFRLLNLHSGFEQVRRIIKGNLATATPFGTLQESGDARIRSNLYIR